MAFKITVREEPTAALRRLATEQIDQTLAEIDAAGADQAEAVHSARRRSKRLRGLIRLFRDSFPDYAAANRALRDAAGALSATRDADVLFVTLHKILARMGGDARDTFAPVGDRLRAVGAGPAQPGDTGAELDKFRDSLTGLRKAAEGWTLRKEGFRAIADSLCRTYADMREAMAEARRSGRPEDFHEWRKAAKYHWHHLCLIRECAPDILSSARDAASDLGDRLGDHHDLAVLADSLKQLCGEANLPPLGPLLAAVEQRMDELAASGLRLGAQLSAEDPEAFRHRIRNYWKAWQREASMAHAH